jgi:hypothetical protein
VWTPRRVAAALATANGDPNKISNTPKMWFTVHAWLDKLLKTWRYYGVLYNFKSFACG